MLFIASLCLIGCHDPGQSNAAQRAVETSVLEVVRAPDPFFVQPEGSLVSVPVRFANPSDEETLSLNLKQRSCGCIDYTLQPEVLEPSEEGVLTLQTVLRETGSRNLSLTFETGLAEPAEMRFDVTCRAYPYIEFAPAETRFLRIPPGTSQSTEFTVIQTRPVGEGKTEPDVSLSSASAKIRLIDRKARVEEGVRRTSSRWSMTISVPPDVSLSEDSVRRETVSVRDGDVDAVYRVLWRPENHVQAVPPSVLVRSGTDPGFKKTLEIRAEEPFQITSVESENPGVQVDAEIGEPKTRHSINILLVKTLTSTKATKSEILLHVNHPDQAEVSIPVYLYR